MIQLIALVLGLLIGLLLQRHLRPLLLERWRALPLVPVLLAAYLLPALFEHFWPELLWAEDRSLLITLLVFPYLIALLLILINCLPARLFPAAKLPIHWYHRVPLLIIAAGLIAGAAVLIANHGYMPIPESYLADIQDIALTTGIRNQSLYLKQLIGPDTILPWLGQIWRGDFLTALHLSQFPYISPAEVITATGLLLTGAANFFGGRDQTSDLSPEPTKQEVK